MNSLHHIIYDIWWWQVCDILTYRHDCQDGTDENDCNYSHISVVRSVLKKISSCNMHFSTLSQRERAIFIVLKDLKTLKAFRTCKTCVTFFAILWIFMEINFTNYQENQEKQKGVESWDRNRRQMGPDWDSFCSFSSWTPAIVSK